VHRPYLYWDCRTYLLKYMTYLSARLILAEMHAIVEEMTSQVIKHGATKEKFG